MTKASGEGLFEKFKLVATWPRGAAHDLANIANVFAECRP